MRAVEAETELHRVLAGLVVTGIAKGAWAVILGPEVLACCRVRARGALPAAAKCALKIWMGIAERAETRLRWLRVQVVQIRARLQGCLAVRSSLGVAKRSVVVLA
jgi:hypothetical protein